MVSLREFIGALANTVEHALPFPFKDITYWILRNVLWKMPIDFYTDKCFLCKNRKITFKKE